MKIKIWGARGSIPAPIRPEAIREKIISALLGIAKIEQGELREDLIAAILENPEHAVHASGSGIYEKVYEKIQIKRRQVIETYLDNLPPLRTGTAGGNTPCIEIQSGDDLFIIDAGSGIRELGQTLMQGPCGRGEGVIHLLFSHPHWDHIQGFPFFRPAFIPGNKLFIYGVHDLEAALRRQQEAISFPISLDYMQATMIFKPIKPGDILEFGNLRIHSIRNQHPGDAYGFRFEKGNKAFVYASDAAYSTSSDVQSHLNFFQDADILIFDAQFTQRESDEKEDWGHSSSFVGVEMAQQANVKNLVLFHYDPTYSDQELEQILERTLKFQQNQYPTNAPVEITIAQEGQTFELTPDQTTYVQQVPGSKAAILQPRGIFDERIALELKGQLDEVAKTDWLPQIIIDMAGVELLQVAGLRALVKLRKEYQEQGTSVALVGPSINVQQLIELAGYLDFFAIYPSVREALKALEARETLNLPGQMLKDRYRIEDKIGEGRLGTVFGGTDIEQNTPVAIKILSPSFSEGAIEQFLRQARQIIDLIHPNVVNILECDEDRGITFMVEEFIESKTLRELMDENPGQPLVFDIALSIAESITRALEYAHANGVIHGDLKPKNVLLPGQVKISDFGLGRLESGKSLVNLDVPLTLVTARYLAPEQVLGHPIDARTDLYALGVILYEMFTGRPPFEGSDEEVLKSHRTSFPVPPREINPNLSRSLEHLILKLLDKDPNKRYANARQVRYILNSMATAVSGEVQPRVFAIEQWPALVGREDVLSRLTGLWSETQQGRGQLIFIRGEPGIGKTRLIQELIYYLDATTLFIGNCQRLEGSIAYHPFVAALTTYLNSISTEETAAEDMARLWPEIVHLAPELSQLIPDSILHSLDESKLGRPTTISLAKSIAQATAKRPWLLILDDLQWADHSSLKLLNYLARHCGQIALMIVGVFDDSNLGENQFLTNTLADLKQQPNHTTIPLKGLVQGEVKELLENIWSQFVPTDLVKAVYNRTGGNPLYIEEVAKGLIDGGVVTWRDNKWHFGAVVESSLPKHINEAILRRINRLSRETQTFLNQAAIFDPVIKFEDLHEMSDLSEWDALESLNTTLEGQFLKAAPADKILHFSHAKIQEVLYQGLSSLRRQLMHREAGEALERQYPSEPKEIPEALAHHFFQANELEKGLIYSIQAATKAQAVYADQNALYWYTRALDAMDQLGIDSPTQRQRFELLLAREQIYHHQGNRQAQTSDLAALQSLAQSLADPAKQALIHNRQAAYAYVLNRLDDATTEAQAGLIAARQANDPVLESESLSQMARIAIGQGRFDPAQEQLYTAKDVLKESDNRQAEIKSLNDLSTLYRLRNNYSKSEAYAQQALEMSQLIGDRYGQAIALSNLGEILLKTGDYTNAKAYQQQALAIHHFIGNRQGEAICLNRLATLYKEVGSYDMARKYIEQAISIHRDIEDEQGVAEDLQVLGSVHLLVEEYDTARDYLEQALAICQDSNNKVQQGSAWLELAVALEGLAQLAKAGDAYEQAKNLQEEMGNSINALDARIGLARCLLAENKTDEALQAIQAFLEEPGPNGWGIKYPVRFYLTAYRILAAANKPQRAMAALEKGNILLQHRANGIGDSQMQTSFIENVPENKELLAQLQQQKLEEATN